MLEENNVQTRDEIIESILNDIENSRRKYENDSVTISANSRAIKDRINELKSELSTLNGALNTKNQTENTTSRMVEITTKIDALTKEKEAMDLKLKDIETQIINEENLSNRLSSVYEKRRQIYESTEKVLDDYKSVEGKYGILTKNAKEETVKLKRSRVDDSADRAIEQAAEMGYGQVATKEVDLKEQLRNEKNLIENQFKRGIINAEEANAKLDVINRELRINGNVSKKEVKEDNPFEIPEWLSPARKEEPVEDNRRVIDIPDSLLETSPVNEQNTEVKEDEDLTDVSQLQEFENTKVKNTEFEQSIDNTFGIKELSEEDKAKLETITDRNEYYLVKNEMQKGYSFEEAKERAQIVISHDKTNSEATLKDEIIEANREYSPERMARRETLNEIFVNNEPEQQQNEPVKVELTEEEYKMTGEKPFESEEPQKPGMIANKENSPIRNKIDAAKTKAKSFMSGFGKYSEVLKGVAIGAAGVTTLLVLMPGAVPFAVGAATLGLGAAAVKNFNEGRRKA